MTRTTLDRRSPAHDGVAAARAAGTLPWLAAGSLVVLLAGVAAGAVLGGVFPSPFGDAGQIQEFFADHAASVQATAVCGIVSALPLLAYAAVAVARTGGLGPDGWAAALALGASTVCVTMMGASGLLQWVLTRDAVLADPALVRGVHDLSFLTGGVGAVVFLGAFVAALALAALRAGLIPRAVALPGLGIGTVGMVSIVSLLWSDVAVLLPIGRFPGLVWMVVAGVFLARGRAV